MTCKAEVFKTEVYGKRQGGRGTRSIKMVAAAVGGPFYISIIYCLTVAGFTWGGG